MYVIDGNLLFQVYVLSVLHELYTQKHLSAQVQYAQLSVAYQQLWLEACTKLSSLPDMKMEMYDFCSLLFASFSSCRRCRIYKNPKITAQVFAYSVQHDRRRGFSLRQFKHLLQTPMIGHESQHMTEFRHELCKLTQAVLDQRKMPAVRFSLWRDYYHLFQQLAVQYEFQQPDNPDQNMRVFVPDVAAPLVYTVMRD